jgi:hypothetical protein
VIWVSVVDIQVVGHEAVRVVFWAFSGNHILTISFVLYYLLLKIRSSLRSLTSLFTSFVLVQFRSLITNVDMAHPANGHPGPNTFANPYGQQMPYPQAIRQDYDNDSEIASPYTSTTRLAGNQPYYDHIPYAGAYLSS